MASPSPAIPYWKDQPGHNWTPSTWNEPAGLRTQDSGPYNRRAVTVQTPQPVAESQPSFTLNDLLIYMAKQQASDLHLKPMRPPLVRVQGKLVPIKTDPLKPADLERMR